MTTACAHQCRRSQSGFTLLEIAIVLAIIGTIIAIALPIATDVARKARENTTNANLSLVEDSLVTFVRLNGRLPCPAAPNGDPLGAERATCATAATAEGIVPFRTLGLGQDQVTDGYGAPITYAVAWNAATTTSTGAFCGVTGTTQAATLTIQDENAVAVTTEMVSFALVGHGENSSGAFIPPGTSRWASSGGAFETENSDADGIFVSSLAIGDGGANGPYDDNLRWMTRDEIGARLRDEGCDGATETEANFDIIEAALISFLNDQGRLPCPAAPNGTPLGQERATCTTNATLEGIVPFRTLGLTEDDVLDGYGRHLTYRVAQNYAGLTASTDLIDYCAIDPGAAASSLTINDTNGVAVTTSPIAVAVWSHGENGFGFFQVPAATRYSAGGGDSFEDENTDGDTTLIDDGPVANGYDDEVAWWTKTQLADPLGGCDNEEVTDAHLDQIETALVAFLARNGRIPCPARPQDNSPLGVEYTAGDCDDGDEIGIVPFRTLGLTEEIAEDGYGRLFTYHATEAYTDTGTLADFFCEDASSLTVEDENGDDVVDDYDVTPIVYVLVSHGLNGYGHYVAGSAGNVSAGAGVPFEDENADEDEDFIDAPFITTGLNDGYDDTTRWRTRDVLSYAAGGTGIVCP